jgi:hypothetical protein
MIVDSRRGNDVTGRIIWKTMKCTTKFTGKINGDQFSFDETEIVKVEDGGDEAEVPMSYAGTIPTGQVGTVSGQYFVPGPSKKKPVGKFQIEFA